MLTNFITAALLAIFLQNAVFEKALGINILLYASRQKSNVIWFTVGLCFITTLSSALAWCLNYSLGKLEFYYLFAPVLYILTVSIIYITSLIIVWHCFPKFFRKIKKFIHLTVFNCAVLGALFLGSQTGNGFFGYVGYGFGTALGFFAAGYLLYIAHARLNSELVPASFRGMPIMLIYVGIISAALQAVSRG